MLKKLVAVLVCVIACFSVVAPCTVASDAENEMVITIDVNERYTDISEIEDVDNIIAPTDEEQKKESQKATYIAVLSIALVVAIIVLIVTLKRLPKESEVQLGDKEDKDIKKE